jgi:hypothetical protein
MTSGLGLVVCGHLRAEADAVVRSRGWQDVPVLSVPPRCERPWECWCDVLAAAGVVDAGVTRVVAVGGGCLPKANPNTTPNVASTVSARTCFGLLTNESLVDAWTARGCHLLTPGWLRHWRETVTAWGFDAETARAHFGEFAQTLLLLDTGTSADAVNDLRALSTFLGIPAETVAVGLDVFGDRLDHALAAVRMRREAEDALAQSAETGMLLDLAGGLLAIGHELDVLDRILEILEVLLPTHRARVASVKHGCLEHSVSRPSGLPPCDLQACIRAANGFVFLPDQDGFLVPFRSGEEVVGVVEITGIAIPRFISHYANLVLAMAALCAAAIAQARALAGVIPICSGCKRIRDAAGSWQQIEECVSRHSAAEFSHGLCPDCSRRRYPELEDLP